MTRRFLPYVPPALLLAALLLAAQDGDCGSRLLGWLAEQPYLGILPYVVLALCVPLGVRFHLTAVAFPNLFLATALHCLAHAFCAADSEAPARIVLVAVVAAAPLNTFLFLLLRERGVWNLRGATRAGAILAESLALLMLTYRQIPSLLLEKLDVLLSRGFWPWLTRPPGIAIWIGLSCAGILALARRRQIQLRICSALALCALWPALVRPLSGPDPHGEVLVAAAFSVAGIVWLYAILDLAWGSAYVDPLTRLPTRRALNEDLAKLGRVFAVAMVDVDHFKRLNDQYGHQIGDQVLRFVAARVQRAAGGKAYRYGGEEFAILWPNRAAPEIEGRCKAIREHMADSRFVLRSSDRPKRRPKRSGRARRRQRASGIAVTVSIGVAGTETGSTPHEVIAAADQALYQAKRRGRNRVVLA